MKIDDKRVTFPKSLSVKYAGKIVEETETHLTLEGEDEESYLKIFNPFRGVAKLLMFENDQWVDAETSAAVSNFDLSSLGLGDLSALSPDGTLPEIIELRDHPWFVGVQFHPEFKSRPFTPHPLFSSFIMSMHSSTHSSQINTVGPAINFLTSCWLFPQKEQ